MNQPLPPAAWQQLSMLPADHLRLEANMTFERGSDMVHASCTLFDIDGDQYIDVCHFPPTPNYEIAHAGLQTMINDAIEVARRLLSPF